MRRKEGLGRFWTAGAPRGRLQIPKVVHYINVLGTHALSPVCFKPSSKTYYKVNVMEIVVTPYYLEENAEKQKSTSLVDIFFL